MHSKEQQHVAIVTDLVSRELRTTNHKLFVTNPFVNNDHGSSWQDSGISPQFVVEELTKGTHLSTAAPGPDKIAEVYEIALLQEKITDVLHISVGTEFSKGYKNAIFIAQQEYPGKAHHLDSQTVFDGTGIMAGHALELAKQGFGVDEIMREMKSMKHRVAVFAFLFKPEFAIEGGRLGNNMTKQLLKITGLKAVVEMDHNTPVNHGLARTRKQGMERLIEAIDTVGGGRVVEQVIFTTSPTGTISGPKESKQSLSHETEYLWENLPGRQMDTKRMDTTITPSLTVHVGPAAHGVVVLFRGSGTLA